MRTHKTNCTLPNVRISHLRALPGLPPHTAVISLRQSRRCLHGGALLGLIVHCPLTWSLGAG